MTDGTIAKIGSPDKLKGLDALQRKVRIPSAGAGSNLGAGFSGAGLPCHAGVGGPGMYLELSLPSLRSAACECAMHQPIPTGAQDQELVRQRFSGVGKAPRKTGVHTHFG